MRHLFQQYLVKLVQAGLLKLKRYGETDRLDRRVVYLVHRTCYCSITVVDWGTSWCDRSCGLFFWGWYRPVRWWSIFSFWDWQTPSHPRWVTREIVASLRNVGVQVWQLARVLRILRHSRVISREEFNCATLLGASR